MKEFYIETAVIEDAPQIAKLEEKRLVCPWSLAVIQKEIRENHLAQYLVLKVDSGEKKEIIGSVGYWKIGVEWSINNVVVSEEWEGQGLGTKLMEALISKAKQEGALQLMLEVGQSNKGAQRLYEKVGFFVNGRREDYYSGEGEAALLMCCLLGE